MASINRKNLSEYENKKGFFKAVFKKLGFTTDGYCKRTMLLTNCIDLSTGKVISDHTWIACSEILPNNFKLSRGAIVLFEASAYSYFKEKRGKVLSKNFSFGDVKLIEVKKKVI